MATKIKNKKIAVIGENPQSNEDKWTEAQINSFYPNKAMDSISMKTTLINNDLQFYTNEFYHFILVNILRGLTKKQQFDLIKTISTKIDNNDYWEEIGSRCTINQYNFWEDLKEQFKKEFILNKRQ